MDDPDTELKRTVTYMSGFWALAMIGWLIMEVSHSVVLVEIGYSLAIVGVMWYVLTPIYHGYQNGYTDL